MANTVKMKRSATPSKVPTTLDLDLGEIAINTYDGKMYIKKDNGTASIVQIGAGGSGTGNVVGPTSSTDNALVRFDGTTGELIKNSNATLSDAGTLNVSNLDTDYIQIDTAATPPTIVEGTLAWDDGEGTLDLGLKGGNVIYNLGEQEFCRVYNDQGATITKGQVVYISGAQGNRVAVKLAQANTEINSRATIGFVAETMANGAEGWVQISGKLPKLNTTGLTAGSPLYLSATTAGAYTQTRPTAPNNTVILGWVERISSTVGSIYIKVDNGYELDELHNVLIDTPVNGDTLVYNATVGVWENSTLFAGTGISVTNGAGTISITNVGVTNATALAPLHTSGGTTPEFYIDQSTSTTNGYLSSTDWNTFNNKGSGSVTSVALSVPTGLSIAGSPVTTTGTLAITYASGYSLPSNATQTNWTTAYNERQQWDGDSTNLNATLGRTSLGATTLGNNLFTITNPSAITFPRFNADNTVTALTDSLFRTATGSAASGANTDITSITLTSGTITSTPSADTDIANKFYVDSIAQGLNFHAACNYATASALPANTYDNGSSGIGATLTGNANGALSVDGSTPSLNQRILVKNESTQENNGIYKVTQIGNGSTPYILTRAVDYDSSGTGTNEIDQGDLVLVLSGTTNANTSWVQQTALPITVGTTALVFVQFGASQVYTAGTGLTLSTNQFSITNVGTAGTYGSASSVPVITTNAQGQVTSVTNTSIAIAGSAVSGNITGNAANVTGTVALANGGTGQTSASAAMGALIGFTSTATAAGTTTLTNASSYYQLFTGTTTQTIVLPVTSTLSQGWSYHIVNNSTGNLTVNSSGSNLVCTVLPQTTAMITCILTSGTTAASWEYGFTDYSETAVVQFGSFGVGTAASGTVGEIRATNNVTAYYTSDKKFKENIRAIPSALPTVCKIGGKLFDWTDEYIAEHGGEDGYFVRKQDFGVIAQDVQEVFDVAVRTKQDGTLAVDYEKMCALAFAAIKELNQRIVELELKVK